MRKIVVNDRTYFWRVGRGSTVVIRDDEGKSRHINCATILGVTNDEYERGQWKRYLGVTPFYVAKWIRENL